MAAEMAGAMARRRVASRRVPAQLEKSDMAAGNRGFRLVSPRVQDTMESVSTVGSFLYRKNANSVCRKAVVSVIAESAADGGLIEISLVSEYAENPWVPPSPVGA